MNYSSSRFGPWSILFGSGYRFARYTAASVCFICVCLGAAEQGSLAPPIGQSGSVSSSNDVLSVSGNRVADTSTPAPNKLSTPAGQLSPTNDMANLPGRNMDALDDKQRLGVGVRISFRVIEDQEEPKALTITDAGELDVPELGLVPAVGKTCKQLAFEIKSKLEQVTYYRATVVLGIDLLNKTLSGRRVYVAGEVWRAGPQEIPAGEAWTVTKAIMKAGGFTDYGDKKKVRLVRGGAKGQQGKTFTLNVVDIWEKGRMDLDLSVEPEDLIYVPARAVNFY